MIRTVAAYADMAITAEPVVAESGVWPVDQRDLDREIARVAADRGWTVRGVGEPVRRGPLRLSAVDPDTGGEFEFSRWQLYAYVDVLDG